MGQCKTWREAIQRVLAEEGRPMHYGEISEEVLTRGYYETSGATPDVTVNAQITASIKNDGERTPFVRVGPGIFALRDMPTSQLNAQPAVERRQARTGRQSTTAVPVSPTAEYSEAIIKCLGMYWRRDMVIWSGRPRLLGKQPNAKAVDFFSQLGVYILYDHHTVVYVGRSVDRPIGLRLFEHTTDRLASRWDRFSWFGLLGVNDDGSLVESPLKVDHNTLIGTFEALLIEALEPPQNRKRGDSFSVAEYLQDRDPAFKDREVAETLQIVASKLRTGP